MKRFTKIMFVIGSAALLFATSAQAQTSTSTPGAANPAVAVDITLSGTIQSSLVLTVSGTTNNTLTAGTSLTYDGVNAATRSAGSFAFGTFNTQSGAGVSNGSFHRVTNAVPGAFVVAALTATITATGAPAAPAVTIAQGTAVNVAAGNARFAAGAGTWTADTSGVDLNAGAGNLCGGACASATPIAHELAIFLPDTNPTGVFSQVFMYDASL